MKEVDRKEYILYDCIILSSGKCKPVWSGGREMDASLPWAQGWETEGNRSHKATGKILGVMCVVIILIVMVVASQVYKYVKTHQIMWFVAYQLYLNKAVMKKHIFTHIYWLVLVWGNSLQQENYSWISSFINFTNATP